MGILRAIYKGLMRMTESSALVLVMWGMVLLSALPMAVVMENTLRTDVGSSLIHEEIRQGLDMGWLEEFHHRGGEFAATLLPARVTPALVFDNLELWFSGAWITEYRGLAAAGGLFLVFWILLQGGVLSHLATPGQSFGWSSFLGAGGAYFWRFLRIAVIMGFAYYGVFRLAYWLFPVIKERTRDLTVERTALIINVMAALFVVVLLGLVHLVSDFARIATIREQRRSMVLALIRSLQRVILHPLQSFGLLGVMSLLLLLVQWVYFWTAPGVRGTSFLALLLTFLIGQLYLMARWALRIARYGAELELFDLWSRPPLDSGRRVE